MKMRNIAANMMTILIVAGIVLVGVIGVARQQVVSSGPLLEPVRYSVERGARFDAVAEDLAEAGVVENLMLFRLAGRYGGQANNLKFGEYEFDTGASMQEVLDLLARGGNVNYTLTIPPGMTVAMAVDRINGLEPLKGELAELPPEGSLFPDTWAYQRGGTRTAIVERMQAKMRETVDEVWESRSPDNPLETKEQLIILASIIEKETTPREHKKVASVFINRLNKGMKLQTDPTVIYGITLGQAPLGRGLRRSELAAPTPYNTYVIQGLPPTPIANPSRESLEAAANPVETPYLYFVADGTGGHAFAETLDEHNRNVAVWRRIERERKANE
ncbi:MAG: endolytic transglycosylase MltG [Pseudomonadota bacterium]